MCVCVCFSETLENKRAWAPLAVLHAHKAYVATLFRSDSKFSLFMRSQPPTHLFCLPLFPRGLPHPPPPWLYCFLCLSHTPFSLFNSLFQSKYYLTSSQHFSASFSLPPRPSLSLTSSPPAVFSSLQRGEPLSRNFPGQKRGGCPQRSYACGGYNAVY